MLQNLCWAQFLPGELSVWVLLHCPAAGLDVSRCASRPQQETSGFGVSSPPSQPSLFSLRSHFLGPKRAGLSSLFWYLELRFLEEEQRNCVFWCCRGTRAHSSWSRRDLRRGNAVRIPQSWTLERAGTPGHVPTLVSVSSRRWFGCLRNDGRLFSGKCARCRRRVLRGFNNRRLLLRLLLPSLSVCFPPP